MLEATQLTRLPDLKCLEWGLVLLQTLVPRLEQPSPVQPNYYVIAVIDVNNCKTYYKASPTLELSRIMSAYCKLKYIDPQTVDFFYNNKPLTGDMRVSDTGLKDESNVVIVRQKVRSLLR